MPAWMRTTLLAQSTTADDLVWLDIATIAARVRSRDISIVDLTSAYLRHIERLNPALTAYVTVTADRARADARRGTRVGAAHERPLHGVPIAHKDLFETAGIRTTAGSPLFDQHVPVKDATIVARLAAAGTVMLGKTNTHELGGGVTTINPFYGTTHNPWDRTRVAGGSSGGSAVAVTAGLAAAATGSDTGGSVRIPAAFCGCVGFKPTFGRVSTAGLLGASPSFDHSGILTRTVADAELIYRVIAGYDPADPFTVPALGIGTSNAAPGTRTQNSARSTRTPDAALRTPNLTGVRIGIPRNFFFDKLQPDVARAVEHATATLREARAEVREVTFPIDSDTMSRIFDPIVVAEIHERFARDWQARPEAFSKSFARFFQAPVPSGLQLAAAHRALGAYQAAVRSLFETVDLVLTPTVPIVAPAIEGPIDGALILRNTWPFNAARTPAISVPCGLDAAGLPIGLQLVVAPDDEDTLFRAGRLFQTVTRWHSRRPPLEPL